MTVIKSKLSGYYFKDFGVWTSNPRDAVPFIDEWSARDFIRRERISDVQVIDSEITIRHWAEAA